jgi:hypothetical protein
MASGTFQPIRSDQARSLMDIDDSACGRVRHYFDHETGEL